MPRNWLRSAESPFRHSPYLAIAAISPDSLAGNQTSKRTHHFDIKHMRNNERLFAPEQIASNGIGQRAVREEFHYNGGVENDHSESRSSRTTCAGLRLARMGLACCVRSNHSCIVGRSAARANSLLRKSERLMPSRAARDFRVPWTCSGTFRTWITLDMSQAYKHGLRMSIVAVFRIPEISASCDKTEGFPVMNVGPQTINRSGYIRVLGCNTSAGCNI
jgi:hypothetical protein